MLLAQSCSTNVPPKTQTDANGLFVLFSFRLHLLFGSLLGSTSVQHFLNHAHMTMTNDDWPMMIMVSFWLSPGGNSALPSMPIHIERTEEADGCSLMLSWCLQNVASSGKWDRSWYFTRNWWYFLLEYDHKLTQHLPISPTFFGQAMYFYLLLSKSSASSRRFKHI